MPVILCFGDSNTWGYDPETAARFPHEARYASVLQAALGSDYLIIPEGLNGRTTVWDDPVEGDKSGLKHLSMLLTSHKPIDLVTIMLGTNDLKHRFGQSAYDIARSAGTLVELVQKSDAGPNDSAPQVLLIAPPKVTWLCDDFAPMFESAIDKSADFPACYAKMAEDYGCHFFDAGTVVDLPNLDGIHLDAQNHRDLGEALVGVVKDILS